MQDFEKNGRYLECINDELRKDRKVTLTTVKNETDF